MLGLRAPRLLQELNWWTPPDAGLAAFGFPKPLLAVMIQVTSEPAFIPISRACCPAWMTNWAQSVASASTALARSSRFSRTRVTREIHEVVPV